MRLIRPRGTAAPHAPAALTLTLALLTLATTGCDSASFVPPRPPELQSLGNSVAVPTAKTLAMILDPRDTPERTAWVNAARQEAGNARTILAVERPKPGAPPSAQAEVIRKAVESGGAAALIVEPIDDPAVTAALREVRAKGTPVVLLGRKLDSGDPAAPFASVTNPPPAETADALVKALLADARSSGLSAASHALIVLNTRSGPGTEEMAAALAAALKAGGVPRVDTVPFKGEYDEATKNLLARLAADPAAALIVAAEDQGLAGALQAFDRLKSDRSLVMVGFTTVDRTVNPAALSNCAAVADRNVPTLARQAVLLALKLTRHEPTSADLIIPRPIHGRTADRSTPLRQATPAPPPPPQELNPKGK